MTSPQPDTSTGRCLWWPPGDLGLAPAAELPVRTDVAIVGGGYTGLAAARALARAGAAVTLVERHRLGWGASGRNGGMVLPGYKADLAAIVRRFGPARARELFDDSLRAIDFVEALVREEGIACDWARVGHVTLAARPRHLDDLARTQRMLAAEFGHSTELLGPDRIGEEIGSARYAGGLRDPAAGALQPAAYVGGLANAARRAGATLIENVEAQGLRRNCGRIRLETSRGVLDAEHVLIATNGYTGRLIPWLARRVVPIGSFIVATAPMPVELQRRLIPRGRMFSDTKHLLYYFRLSPDGRLVFGGRAAFLPAALARSRTMLERGIVEVYPELAGMPIEFAWAGTLGFTRDLMPHTGRLDGVAYALGYGGHGVAMASWLGDQVGRALAGAGPWPALGGIPFPAIPGYHGWPWFLPFAGSYYRILDWLD